MLDSDYLTMLSSSDKLMSGEFEALARLQAELDLFDDPNRNEEIVEQMTVENHLDLIEEEVCSDTGDSITGDMVKNIKVEVVSNDNLEATVVKPQTTETPVLRTIKTEPTDSEDENVVVTLKPPQSEILSISSSNATKRSAPPSAHENQQSKKAVICLKKKKNFSVLMIIISFFLVTYTSNG